MSKTKATPAEVALYGIFQEGRKYIYGLRDHDCENCGFGGMAMRVAVYPLPADGKLPALPGITVSICADCKHVEVVENNFEGDSKLAALYAGVEQ